MSKQRCFNSPAISRREEITSVSHPWANPAAGCDPYDTKMLRTRSNMDWGRMLEILTPVR